jgi:hypothetical protein
MYWFLYYASNTTEFKKEFEKSNIKIPDLTYIIVILAIIWPMTFCVILAVALFSIKKEDNKND